MSRADRLTRFIRQSIAADRERDLRILGWARPKAEPAPEPAPPHPPAPMSAADRFIAAEVARERADAALALAEARRAEAELAAATASKGDP